MSSNTPGSHNQVKEMSFRDQFLLYAKKRGYEGPMPDPLTLMKILRDLTPIIGPVLVHSDIQKQFIEAQRISDISAQIRLECEHLLVFIELAIDSCILTAPIATELAHASVAILSHIQRIRTTAKHLILEDDPLLPLAVFLLQHPKVRALNRQVLTTSIIRESRNIIEDVLAVIPRPADVFKQWEKRQDKKLKVVPA